MTSVHNIKIYKKRRKYLRNNAPKAEKLFWNKIKNSKIGYKFRRQHSIMQYILDFYCPKIKLAVELDGEVHNYKKQKEKDWIREQELEKLNIKLVRYKNVDIFENLDKTINHLIGICEDLNNINLNQTTPNPSLSKEGRCEGK